MKTLVVVALLLLSAAPAQAWQIYLDLDADHDPNTLSLSTTATSAEIALQLWPDFPGEVIEWIDFGMGHTCTQCGDFTTIADRVTCGLYQVDQEWAQHPAFSQEQHSVATCLDCCDESTGWEDRHRFSAVANSPLALQAPLTLARFEGWVLQVAGPYCPRVQLALGVVVAGTRHSVDLASDVIPTAAMHWGTLKAAY